MSEHDETADKNSINWSMLGVICFGTMYLLLVDYLFPVIEKYLVVDSTQSSTVSMPFFWLGFSVGALNIYSDEVKGFVSKVMSQYKFIILVLVLEIIGASFYIFEFFGLSKISATLVALVTGAHIVFVWVFDLYVRKKHFKAVDNKNKVTGILFFKLDTENLVAYSVSKQVVLFQGLFVFLALIGLGIWP